MAKVRIKKLPRGFKVNKGRLLKTMNTGGKTGDQHDYGLTTFTNNNLSLQNDPFNTVNSTLGPVPREEANLEAERGETALTDLNNDGAFELYNISGNRHSSGGTPLNLPPQSFIYSDTASMKLNKDELLEIGINSKKKITPAKVSKNYDLNKYISVLNDPDSDHISIDTAEYMLDKNKNKLSQLAFIQEAKKGFEEGVPVAAYPYIQGKGVDPIQFSQQVQNISQQEAEAQALLQLPVDMREKVMQLQQMFKQIDLEKNPEKLDKHIAQKQEISPDQGQGMPQMQAPNPMQPPEAPGAVAARYGREIPQAQFGYFKDKYNQAKDAYKNSSFYKTGQKALDYTQDALSVAGMTPAFGAAADIVNTAISGARVTGSAAVGDTDATKKNAKDLAWNAAAIVPGAGQAATTAKFANRTVKAVNKRNQAVGAINLAGDVKDEVTGAEGSISDIASNPPIDASSAEPQANMAMNADPTKESEEETVARMGGDPFNNLKTFTDNLDMYQVAGEVNEDDDISNQDQKKQEEGVTVAPRKQGEFQYSDDSQAVRDIMQDQYNIYEMPDEGSIQGIDQQSRADGSLDYADEEATRNIISSPEGQKDFYERNKNTFADIGITDFDMYNEQYVGRDKDSSVVKDFQTKHRENYLHAFDNDEGLRNQLIEQFGDEDAARKAFMSSMSFTEDGKGNPFGIDNKHGVYTHGVSDFSKKPDEIVCKKCGEDGKPISQVFKKEEGCGEGWVAEAAALDCGTEEEEEQEQVETVDQVPAEPEFWLQDQLGLMNAIDNKFNLKKYYPWAPRIEKQEIDAVFEDPTREIAAIGEQAAIAAQTATAFSGPQRAGAVQAKAQGVAAQQIADTMARVQGSNVKTANVINSKNAELASAADIENKAQLKKLYDDTIMVEQNYDNALKEANAEVTKQMQNMYTNRAYTHNLNQLYPEFNVHPQTGGLAVFDPTSARDLTDSGRVSTSGQDTSVDDYLERYNINMEDLTAEERMKLYNSQGNVNTRGISSDPREMYMRNTLYPGGVKQTQLGKRGKEIKKQRILKKGAELRNWFSPLRAISKR